MNSQTSAAPSCPICDQPTLPYTSKHSHGANWHIRRCTACRHGFVANRPTPDQLRTIYEGDEHSVCLTSSPHVLDARIDCRTLADDIAALTTRRGRSLDVGSGSGGYSYHLRRHGFSPTMIDLDPRAEAASSVVQDRLFFREAFEDLRDAGPYSAIVLSQVLEHALDPFAWMRHAHDLLEPGGIVAVAVPNFAGLYSVLGKRDPFLAPPIHLNFFTPASLRQTFERSGLRVARITSRSELTTEHDPRTLPLKTQLVRAVWNRLASPLNLTARGIILRGYAIRKTEPGVGFTAH